MFGEVSLEGPGFEVRNFGTIRAAKLLVILSLTRSARMPREHLAEHLWPDDLYDATRLRLRQEIHRLKKALGEAEEVVVTTSTDVMLERSLFETDLDILKKIVQSGGEVREGIEPESLFKLEFLPAWDEMWTLAERAPAEALQLQAGIAYGQNLLRTCQAEKALQVAQCLIPRHPYNEEIRMVAVKAYGEMGSLASAVAEFQQYRRGLKESLGVEPGDNAERVLKELTEAHSQSSEPVQSSQGKDHAPKDRPGAAELIGEVPNPIEPIVGREALLAQVLDFLRQDSGVRLLTMVGPGGIGKTRLAIEAALKIKESDPRRVLYATLAESAATPDWARVLLTQLKVTVPRDADPTVMLSNLLKVEPTLLVLDNAETFMPEISLGVKNLLESSQHLTVLTTSITPLKIGGEVPLSIGPLDALTEGRQILANALKASRPLASSAPGSEAALDEIAALLDGYPLALRLAAARFRLLSPAALLQHLGRSGALAGSEQDLPVRHRSLESALTASYSALDEIEKSALQALCGLPGGAGLELASKLLPSESHLEILERLLDSALIALDDQGTHVRVRILGPVRIFVKDSLSQEDWSKRVDSSFQAVVSYVDCLNLASEAWPSQSQIEALDEENENIQAAWNWALANDRRLAVDLTIKLVFYELTKGRVKQALEKVLNLEPDWRALDSAYQAELEITLSGLYMLAGEPDSAQTALERAEAITQNLDSAMLKARTASSRASYAFRKDFWNSNEKAAAALALSEANKVDSLTARNHQLLGLISWFSKDVDSAIKHMTLAFEQYQKLQFLAQAGFTGLDLAFYHAHIGRKRKTESILAQARNYILKSGDAATIAHMHEMEGRMSLADDRPNEAELSFRESLRLWRAVGNYLQEADQLLSLTRALLAQQRWEEAKETLLESADFWVKDQNSGGLCQSLSSLALLLHKDGRTDEAKAILGYSVGFQQAGTLVLVQPEIEFRQSIIDLVGGTSHLDKPYNLLEARKLFDLLL